MIRVNIDYESVLFHSQLGPRGMNEYLEFLAFFVQDQPVLTEKKYTPDYLDHVERVSGKRPELHSTGSATNWWGPLENIEQERFLNSKLTSTELAISQGWVDARILSGPIDSCPDDFFFKDPFSMSGKGFRPGSDVKLIKKFPQILERKLHRKFDFSHYIFGDGKSIAYSNSVDERFQYKGSEFLDWKDSSVKNLDFYSLISEKKWEEFHKQLKIIQDHYHVENGFGYSVDSFVYEEEGQLSIYPLCEVNYRRTMGRVAYELSQRYAGAKKMTKLVVMKGRENFYKDFTGDGVIVLSPGDAKFELVFFMADSQEELTASLRACGRDPG